MSPARRPVGPGELILRITTHALPDLSLAELKVLACVQAHEGDEDPALTQSRIVELTGVPKQTVGAALDYLGSEGLHEAKREKPPLHLLRRTNRDSRRSNVIELTPKGRSLFS